MDLTGIGSVADLASKVVEKIWPDKSGQEKQELAAALAIVQGQMEINKTESTSSSVFVAGWRPSIGWVCSAAMAYQFVLRPLIEAGFMAAGQPIGPLPGIDDHLWELLVGMLGLGGLRTVEKSKGVAR